MAFFFIINLYFYYFVFPFNSCHGRRPRRKYNNIYFRFFISSRRDCYNSWSAILYYAKISESFIDFKIIINVCKHSRTEQSKIRKNILKRSIGTIFRGEIKISNINAISILTRAHQEVLGFDIAMDYISQIYIYWNLRIS
jgi:hypothetical protein